MAITKIGTDIIANDAITADKIAAGALDTQLAGYLSTNSFATESYVGTAISNLVDSSPATLDTLNELAAALGDDPNFATTTATAIGLKAPIASPIFTGAATFSGNVGIAGQASPTYKLDGGFADQTWGWYLNSSYNAGFTFNTTERSLLIHTKSAENIDHIKFATSSTGAERMRIDASGNVGIGTTSPGYNLHVEKLSASANVDLLVKNTGTDGTSNSRIMSYVSGASGGDPKIGLGVTGVRDYFFRIDNSDSDKLKLDTNGTDIVTIDNSGNVGIGTTAPDTLLHVNGQAKFENNITLNENTPALVIPNGDFRIFTGGAEKVRIDASGNVGLGMVPSAWSNAHIIDFESSDVGGQASVGDFGGQATVGQNFYYGTDYTRKETGYASRFYQYQSAFLWQNAGYAAGGSSIAWETKMQLAGNGDLSITGNVTAPTIYTVVGGSPNMYVRFDGLLMRAGSSLRYKNTVNDATHGLAELLTLRPVTYKSNSEGDLIYGGLIAEEVYAAGLPEFVQYDQEGEPDGLSYGNMVSLCIKAIQEQQTIIEALTARLESLEGDL